MRRTVLMLSICLALYGGLTPEEFQRAMSEGVAL